MIYISHKKDSYVLDLDNLKVQALPAPAPIVVPAPDAPAPAPEKATRILFRKDETPEIVGELALKIAILVFDPTYECGELFFFDYDPAIADGKPGQPVRIIEVEDQASLAVAVKRVRPALLARDYEYLLVHNLGELIDKIPFRIYEADSESKKEAA